MFGKDMKYYYENPLGPSDPNLVLLHEPCPVSIVSNCCKMTRLQIFLYVRLAYIY